MHEKFGVQNDFNRKVDYQVNGLWYTLFSCKNKTLKTCILVVSTDFKMSLKTWK